jgi:hypothetical protein
MASSQDGFAQIIELGEVGGQNGQHEFASLKLTVTNRAGAAKTFVFPANLPSAATANKHVVIGTGNYGGGVSSAFRRLDFNLPQLFLPIDGGTIELGGIDRWTFDAIPTDGRVLNRDSGPGHGTLRNFAGATADCCGPVFLSAEVPFEIDLTATNVIEYYNATLDTYFNSGSQPDIDALETGRIPGWQGVHEGLSSFLASSVPVSFGAAYGFGAIEFVPICRYYAPPASHFLSASADECDLVARLYPEYVLETRVAFYAVLPNPVTGECPPDGGAGPAILAFLPVYRLWNQRTDHRFTPSLGARAEMIANGWISEGYGPLGVAMCGFDLE